MRLLGLLISNALAIRFDALKFEGVNMQYIAVAIVSIVVIIFLIAIVTWIIQWVGACLIWVWQAILQPFFVYFSPAILIILALIGIYLGSAHAMRNYIRSLRQNVKPEGLVGKIMGDGIIGLLTIIQAALYLVFAGASGYLVYNHFLNFVSAVKEYYNSIIFPAYEIVFPFWKE